MKNPRAAHGLSRGRDRPTAPRDRRQSLLTERVRALCAMQLARTAASFPISGPVRCSQQRRWGSKSQWAYSLSQNGRASRESRVAAMASTRRCVLLYNTMPRGCGGSRASPGVCCESAGLVRRARRARSARPARPRPYGNSILRESGSSRSDWEPARRVVRTRARTSFPWSTRRSDHSTFLRRCLAGRSAKERPEDV